jgi:hypothetical protein
MKTKIILILSFTICQLSYSQIPEIKWQTCFGTDQWDKSYGITKKENGYLLAIDIPTNGPGITNYHGESDPWIINTDENGNIIWETCYGGTEGETIKKIIKASATEFYLVGETESGDYDITCDTNYGLTDFWVLKINENSDILWDNCYGSIRADGIRDAILTPDDGLLFMGRISSNGGDVKKYYGSMDLWFCKIDSLGNIEWEKTVGNQSLDNGISMQLISDTSFAFIGGYDDPGGMIDCEISVSGFYADLLLMEMSLTDGDILNMYCYGGSDGDLGFDFEKIADGYILAASTRSNDGDVSGLHGGSDMWVVRTDNQGQIVWQRCLGGSYEETPYYITQVEDGGFIVIGNTSSHNGDVTNNHSHQGGAWFDIWVVKLSSGGEIEWDVCYGGTGTERLFNTNAILKKDDYNYVFNAQAQFNSNDVQCELHGDIDAWVFEIKDCSYYMPAIPQSPTGPDTVCNQSSQPCTFTILPAPLAWDYQWQLLPETAGSIYTDTLQAEVNWSEDFFGTATITVRSTNDCGESEWSEPRYVQVEDCVGIDEHAMEIIKVYPNPAGDYICFEFANHQAHKGPCLEVVNTKGMLIESIFFYPSETLKVWDTRGISPGIYFYRFKSGGLVLKRGKIVLQK